QGRDRRKGVLGNAKSVLDAGVEAALLSPLGVSGGRGGSSGPAALGPAISNTYNVTNNATVNQEIRVESAADTAPGQVRDAGRQAAQEMIVGWQEAATVFGAGST